MGNDFIGSLLKITLEYYLMISPYQERDFQQLRRVIYEKYANFQVDEQELILKQAEVMEECKEKIDRRKAYESFNNISLYPIHNLGISPTSPPSRTSLPRTSPASAINSPSSSRTQF
jgi:hypothetical protein